MRIRELDFLRGIALIAVILTHTVGYFPSKFFFVDFCFGLGRYGVQLFFVISAFTMTMLAQNKSEFNLKDFYVKRFLRIFPLFFIAAILYFPTQKNPNFWNPDGLQFWEFGISIFFLQGFLPTTINSTVPGGWSISNEANFYLIFPIFLKLVNSKFKYLLVILTSLSYYLFITFFGFLFDDFPTYLVKGYFYLFLLNQINVFVFGMFIFNWLHKPLREIKYDLLFFVGYFICILLLCFKLNDFNHLITNFIGFLFAIVLYTNFKFFKFKNRFIEKIGTVTYTGYLIHFGVLMILEKIYKFNFFVAFPIILFLTVCISLYIKPYTEDYWVKIGKNFLNSNSHK